VPRYGFRLLALEAQHCTQALALANGYPAELDRLARALGLDYQKDRDGVRLMREMSRPRKLRKGESRKELHWVDDPEKLARFIEYGRQDRGSRA
jgi:DNA polymerase